MATKPNHPVTNRHIPQKGHFRHPRHSSRPTPRETLEPPPGHEDAKLLTGDPVHITSWDSRRTLAAKLEAEVEEPIIHKATKQEGVPRFADIAAAETERLLNGRKGPAR